MPHPEGGPPPDLATRSCPSHTRSYTPAVVPGMTRANTPPNVITACNDTRLSPSQQAACLRCTSIRRRDACLRTTSDTLWAVDKQSCTW